MWERSYENQGDEVLFKNDRMKPKTVYTNFENMNEKSVSNKRVRLIKEDGKIEPAHTCTLRGTITHQKGKDLVSENLVSCSTRVRSRSLGVQQP